LLWNWDKSCIDNLTTAGLKALLRTETGLKRFEEILNDFSPTKPLIEEGDGSRIWDAIHHT
jgi:hypothetical protein